MIASCFFIPEVMKETIIYSNDQDDQGKEIKRDTPKVNMIRGGLYSGMMESGAGGSNHISHKGRCHRN